jgi:hypothetical protein
MIAHVFKAVLRGLLLLALPCMAAAQTAIGVVASLDPNLRGQAPGAGPRVLVTGAGVVTDDIITSSAQGRAQLLFQDQTTLSIAPNSAVVLDRFIYDPAGRNGEIGLRLTQGTLRFIGGLATRRSTAEIVTPTATVGVRGSTALVQVRGGQTTAVFLSGKSMCLQPNGGERACTNRRGGVLNETGYLGRIDDGALAALLVEIDGAPPSQLARRGTGRAPTEYETGPFGSDGSVRDRGILDDRLGTDTEFGFIPGEEGTTPPDDCFFDGEGIFCPGIGYISF